MQLNLIKLKTMKLEITKETGPSGTWFFLKKDDVLKECRRDQKEIEILFEEYKKPTKVEVIKSEKYED